MDPPFTEPKTVGNVLAMIKVNDYSNIVALYHVIVWSADRALGGSRLHTHNADIQSLLGGKHPDFGRL